MNVLNGIITVLDFKFGVLCFAHMDRTGSSTLGSLTCPSTTETFTLHDSSPTEIAGELPPRSKNVILDQGPDESTAKNQYRV